MSTAPAPPTALTEAIAFAEHRFGRAHEKIRAAQLELELATTGRATALDNLARWRAANPDPQLSMFEGDQNV